MSNTSKEVLRIVALVSVLAVVQAFAWNQPAVAPPNGNTPAPLNVSAAPQGKVGGLTLGALETQGATWLATNAAYKVGIGTNDPQQKLHIVGGKAQADDFCLNSDTTKCLSTATGGVVPSIGKKWCQSDHDDDNWFMDIYPAPDAWTIADCQKALKAAFSGGLRYRVRCVFESSPYVSSSARANINTLISDPPSPNCGW